MLGAAEVPAGVSCERLTGLKSKMLNGDWGCMVFHYAAGFNTGYLDSQYFIKGGLDICMIRTEPLFVLRTHTKNYFPWILNGYTAAGGFEDRGGLIRLPAGAISFRLPAGIFRTSDFFYTPGFIEGYKQPYKKIEPLLDEVTSGEVNGISMPFLLDHIQMGIFGELRSLDTSGSNAAHFVTIKSAEYLMRAMGQLHNNGIKKGERPDAEGKELAEGIAVILRERFDEHLSLKDLARKAGSNTLYIQKAFKERYGMTINKFQAHLRLERAKYLLLKDSRSTFDQIAITVGYYDASAFSRAFKEAFGIRPGAFRKRDLDNK